MNTIDIKQFAKDLITEMHMPGPKAKALIQELCSSNGYCLEDGLKALDETLQTITLTDVKAATLNENISRRVKDYILSTDGRYFDLSDLDNELGYKTTAQKQSRKQAIYRFKNDGLIEAHPSIEGKYRFINREAEKINWVNADPSKILNLKWPCGLDGSSFHLDNIKIFPGSVIVLAGVSNMGKTTFCIGFMLANMDEYHCIYMSNELGDEEFKSRMDNFEYVDLYKAGGIPKFEAVVRYDNYQDIIQPDAINIIDYMDIVDNAWMVGRYIDQIKQKLGKGIALIALQKGVTTINTKDRVILQPKEYATGGQYSEHRARLVIHIDMGVLRIKKCKAWKSGTENPNNKRYSFEIVNGGSRFTNIKEITSPDNEGN